MGDLEEFKRSIDLAVQKFNELLKADSRFLIISDIDADGICSASIVAKALLRKRARFAVKIVDDLTPKVLETMRSLGYDFHLLCDLGAGMVDETKGFLGDKWMILDHHEISEAEKSNPAVINPSRFNYDGGVDISAAGVCYHFALGLDGANIDLAWLPIVASLGDRQDQGDRRSLTGLNQTILDDCKQRRLVSASVGLLLPRRETKPLHESLASLTTPFIPGLTGNSDACLAALASTGIPLKTNGAWRSVAELSEDEARKVVEAVVPYLASSSEASRLVDELVGEVYTLQREDRNSPLRDAREFSTMLNGCGRMGRPGAGIAICLGERNQALTEAEELITTYRQTLAKSVQSIVGEGGRILDLGLSVVADASGLIKESMLGAVASVLSGVGRFETKVLVAKTSTDEADLKISVRRGRLLEVNPNLGQIVKASAEECQGVGGGHIAAAGARIPTVRWNRFIQLVAEGVDASK